MERDGIYRFGPFSLNANERLLLRDGRLVPLAPKALSILLVLVQNRGHVVKKNVLMDEVWPDEDVEDGNLTQYIFMLRRVLGDNPSYIETVPRRGYRFLDAVNGTRKPSKGHAESSDVYQTYLKARHYWNTQTREGLEQAIVYFLETIRLDPSYALPYAGIVDAYLRLVGNYLPPPETLSELNSSLPAKETDDTLPEAGTTFQIEHDWHRVIDERERKRAMELQLDYPAVHQWHAAYLFAQSLYRNSNSRAGGAPDSSTEVASSLTPDVAPARESKHPNPTLDEEVQVSCIIARTQIEAGNYDAACAVLERWWSIGEWPRLDGLNSRSSADLLVTAGTVAGYVASCRQMPQGQKHAETLLNAAIAFFEQLGSRTLSAEGRIELAVCYQREGMLDLARTTFLTALEDLSPSECEIRHYALISLAMVDWQAGRLQDSVARMKEADELAELATLQINARYHMQLATTLQTLATDETPSEYLDRAGQHYLRAINHYRTNANHRHKAIGEGNYGYLLMRLGRLEEAETRLVRARRVFEAFGDKRRRAEIDDTLAHLHLAAGRSKLAEQTARESVESLETGGLEVYLAQSLTTLGLVLCRLGRQREAKRIFERAAAVAERCGCRESAARALLTEVEEMCDQLKGDELMEMGSRLDQLLADSQQASTLERLRKCRELLAEARA